MPILKFYTSPGQLTDEEKQELVTTLTAGYTKIMPDFFVNIMFHELPHGSFFMGGKPTDGKFVRFTAEHIAMNFKEDLERANRYLDWVGQLFTERFEPRGWTWEFSVTESRRELWRIQSLVPPLVGSEPMKSWMEAGKALPWEGGKL
ncbi:putative oxalocrotonate tautomerase [Rhexocercosporidium sp. MPI-PUGE-AT-0058]|nr:putative oxalocrotonate tautomerase [Rhexocercosporidium sp. MPI-PUGE-AT-0058]